MSIGVWAQVVIFTQVWSRDTRRIDFPRVDRLSTDTSGLGRHTWIWKCMLKLRSRYFGQNIFLMGVKIQLLNQFWI